MRFAEIMIMKKIPLAAALGLLALTGLSAPAQAHHSFAAEFDGAKPIRLVGKINKLEWTNPHSYFYLEVVEKGGKTAIWACEGGGPGALSRRGWKKGDVKLGDTLIVDGYLSKDGTRLIDARRIKLPDGRTIYGGTPGDGGPGDGQPQNN
jgi:hypothetical protein